VSDIDRLHDLIERLPPRQIRTLLTLLDTIQPISDEEFAHRLSESAPEEVDDETSARILAAETEQGENVSHDELKRRLGL
jgi:muconolactone delta-isomerase